MPTTQSNRALVTCLVAATFSAACSGPHKAAAAAETAATGAIHSDSAGGLVVAPNQPYVVTKTGTGGVVVATVATATAPTAQPDSGPCEVASKRVMPASDAVFWIEGIRQGKRLPNARRYELVSAGCSLTPRVQAVLIGGAIDVYNDDAVLHRLVFIRAGTNDTLQTMPFTNDGELVATDRLTRTPGIVEVRCAQHPQERAYIAVFDHPYFGVGSVGDKVALDSIPPGDYQMMTWREGMTAPVASATRVGLTGQTQMVVR